MAAKYRHPNPKRPAREQLDERQLRSIRLGYPTVENLTHFARRFGMDVKAMHALAEDLGIPSRKR